MIKTYTSCLSISNTSPTDSEAESDVELFAVTSTDETAAPANRENPTEMLKSSSENSFKPTEVAELSEGSLVKTINAMSEVISKKLKNILDCLKLIPQLEVNVISL